MYLGVSMGSVVCVDVHGCGMEGVLGFIIRLVAISSTVIVVDIGEGFGGMCECGRGYCFSNQGCIA